MDTTVYSLLRQYMNESFTIMQFSVYIPYIMPSYIHALHVYSIIIAIVTVIAVYSYSYIAAL